MHVTTGGATLPVGPPLCLCTAMPNAVFETLIKSTIYDGETSDFAGSNWPHMDQVQYGSNGLHGGMWLSHKQFGCGGVPRYK